ncbi:MAG: dihydropteroate synthase [Nitrospinae bacterium]|nr:dihydropteroate synthase [Nitrospinota bacterium]
MPSKPSSSKSPKREGSNPPPGFPRQYRCGKLRLPFNRPLIMGVINITPDSFSDGGLYSNTADAMAQADRLVADGADILDIGGESTRPGAPPVSAPEEISRVIPVIRGIVSRHPKVPVSVDTSKPEVAREAVEAGAVIINDVTGVSSPQMARIAAQYNLPVVVMHMKGSPRDMAKKARYADLMGELKSYFTGRITSLGRAGVSKIIIDPGLGFAKTAKHNIEILNRLDELVELGYPVLVGASRKSFLGKILGAPPQERDAGTAAVTALAVMKGAAIIRAHNVVMNRHAAIVAASIRDRKV